MTELANIIPPHASNKPPVTNVRFTPDDSTTVLDAHLIKTFRACQQKLNLFDVQHVVPKTMKAAPAFGISMHEGIAVFREARKDGLPYDQAYEKGAVALLTAYKKYMPVEAQSEVKQDEKRSAKNALRLFTGFVQHFEPAGYEYLYVEVPFALHLGEIQVADKWSQADTGIIEEYTTKQVIYVGIIDAILRDHGVIRVNDIKSSSWPISDASLNVYKMDQGLKGYTVAARELLGVDTGYASVHAMWVQGEPKSKNAKPLDEYFHNKDLYWDDAQIAEWRIDTLRTATRIEQCKLSGVWEHDNAASCGAWGGCEYLPVCSVTPAARANIIELDYDRGIWTPLESERMQKL